MGFSLGNIAGSIAGPAGLALGIYEGNQAASAQRQAAGNAANQINLAKNQALGYLQPYSQVGQGALSSISALLLGKSYDPNSGQFSDLSPDQRLQSFFQSPAYQFNLTQGLQAINKSQIARGNSLSGGALKEINDYAQGQASNEYSNYLNSLFGLAGIGQSASAGQANTTIGAGNDLASLAYAGGMGNVNKYNNLSNFGYGLSGMGFSSLLGNDSPSMGNNYGSANTNSGRYNSSYFSQGATNSLSPSTALTMGGF